MVGGDEFFRNSPFFFDQSSVLSICNSIVVNNLYGFVKLFKPSLHFSALSLLCRSFAENKNLLMANVRIH